MAQFNLTTAVELTKRLYPEGLERLFYEVSPLYAMLNKWKQFGGEGKFLTWEFSRSAGASMSFANAQANKGASSFKRPFITRAREYALASMDGEALEATLGDKYAIAELFKVALDDAKDNVTDSLSIMLYGNGGGARGQVHPTTAISTTDLTLASPSQARAFHKNMVVRMSSTDGLTGSLDAGSVVIDKVNRATGVLTATTNWTTSIPTASANDYLFRDGDFGLAIKGLGAWFPTTAPTAGDSFFGIDRSDDPEWLAGVRYAPSSGNYKEILVNAAANLQQVCSGRAAPDLVMMNPVDWGNLMNEVGSHMVIQVPSKHPEISFEGLSLYTGLGKMKVLADPACPRFRAYMLTTSTIEIWSLKDVPRVLDRDGLQSLREGTSDADEIRVGGYLQAVCKNPQKNSVITLPA